MSWERLSLEILIWTSFSFGMTQRICLQALRVSTGFPVSDYSSAKTPNNSGVSVIQDESPFVFSYFWKFRDHHCYCFTVHLLQALPENVSGQTQRKTHRLQKHICNCFSNWLKMGLTCGRHCQFSLCSLWLVEFYIYLAVFKWKWMQLLFWVDKRGLFQTTNYTVWLRLSCADVYRINADDRL